MFWHPFFRFRKCYKASMFEELLKTSSMNNQNKRYLMTSFVVMAVGVVLGAFGAHALKERLTEHYLEVWETANRYHMIHGLGLAIIAGLLAKEVASNHVRRIFIMMMMGLILFSGSLYILSLADLIGMPQLKMMGAITPIGGLLFVAAWIYAACSLGTAMRS